MRNSLVCLFLLAIVFAIYWPVQHFDFVNYDDEGYVYENPHVTRGLRWQNVEYAFRTTDQANYHPLIWISLSLDVSLFGLNPKGFHLENVLLHAANAALLYLFLIRALGLFWPALFVQLCSRSIRSMLNRLRGSLNARMCSAGCFLCSHF